MFKTLPQRRRKSPSTDAPGHHGTKDRDPLSFFWHMRKEEPKKKKNRKPLACFLSTYNMCAVRVYMFCHVPATTVTPLTTWEGRLISKWEKIEIKLKLLRNRRKMEHDRRTRPRWPRVTKAKPFIVACLGVQSIEIGHLGSILSSLSWWNMNQISDC